MSAPIRSRIDKNTALTAFTDLVYNSVGASAFVMSELKDAVGSNKGYDTYTYEDIVIRTAAGGGGTLLDKDTDYTCGGEDEDLTTEVTEAKSTTKTIYTTIQVTNAAYQGIDLYFSGYTVGDYPVADDVNNITWEYSSKSTDYTTTDMPGFTLYSYTTGSDKKTHTLPTVADNDNLELQFMKIDSGYGPLVIDGEGAETINGWSQIALFRQYEKVHIKAINGAWYIIDNWKWHIESGWISRSDWSNQQPGTIDLNYDNLSGTFELFEVITEATSGYRGIILADTGAILRIIYTDDGAGGAGGFFTDGRQITGGSSGATADVNEGTGSTKDVDSYCYHQLGKNMRDFKFQWWHSFDGTENNSTLIPFGCSDSGYGFGIEQNDTNSIIPQFSTNGWRLCYTGDKYKAMAAAGVDDYYNITMDII